MKPSIFLVACLLSLNIFSQTQKLPDSLDLFFSFPCVAFNGEFGIEFDDDNYYTTSWTSDSIGKYDLNGNLVETFTIPEVGKIRDLAYDGEFYFGGTNDSILYIMDFTLRMLITDIVMPYKIQSIAYNENSGLFWVGEEGSSTIYCTDLTGVNLGNVTIDEYDSINITGIAFEEFELLENPYLWIFCSDSSRTFLFKYDIFENEMVGNDIDLTNLVSSVAQTGGLYYNDDWYMADGYIGGLFQDELVFVFELDYANQLVSTEEITLPSKFEVYPNLVTDKVFIETSGVHHLMYCRIFNQNGQLIFETSGLSSKFEVNVDNYPKGTYFVQLSGSEGYSLTKKFIK